MARTLPLGAAGKRCRAVAAEAVRRGQVDLLLFHDDPDDQRRLWFGSRPESVAADPEDLRGLGAEQPGTAGWPTCWCKPRSAAAAESASYQPTEGPPTES